ncbi:MAG: glutamate 5-kinase [Candidatus Omnitrophica bacterium]|nr:glutamate 5-kinase [Candidatus Omnitrophota bacterium]
MNTNAGNLCKRVRRIVLKIGTSVLTTAKGHFSLAAVNQLVNQIASLRKDGKEMIVVSSGAIACGMDTLRITARPRTLPELQACAAVGQGKLMKAYEDAAIQHGFHTAQILLTRDGLYDRLRYLNFRNTLNSLLALGAVPIVNENDSVSTDEIRFGDNDMLSALVAAAVQPDLLILLTDVSGLIDRAKHTRIPRIASVTELDHAIKNHVYDEVRQHTVGGMFAKLKAIRIVMRSGVTAVMADGKLENILEDILQEKDCGTFFIPVKSRLKGRKQWLAHHAKVKGVLAVDSGAYEALVMSGKSLLASGVRRVEGNFKEGDIVSICDHHCREFARGLVNYSYEDLCKIMGKKSQEISAILNATTFREVIHRDNLAVLLENE